MRLLLVCSIALSLAPSIARADAISEPPSCPPQSEPVFCHGPPTCEPRECLSSTDCAPGEHCQVADLCVEEHSCGGIGGGDFHTHVFGLCGAGDTCVQGSCMGQFVCVAGGGEDASVVRDASGVDAGDGRTHAMYGCDCHCSVGAGQRRTPASALPLGAAGLLLVAVRGRRARRSARARQ
jgi:hypothetical protein